jgi:tellurite methyltransferase
MRRVQFGHDSERMADESGPRERWNRRWSESGIDALAREPASWLVENRELALAAGGRRALDLACGDGRNAAYLAELGFEVDAVDVSDVVIGRLRAAAAPRRLAIDARQVDLEREALPVDRYDLVVQINYLQRDLFGSVAAALRPGGIVIAETFMRTDMPGAQRELDPRYLLDEGELRTAFPGLVVLRYREGVSQHADRPRAVASLIARRPA